jgi:exosortase
MLRILYPYRALALALGLLTFLWFILINQVRVEWSVNPQYSYGFVVPLLCLAFLLQRWLSFLKAQALQPRTGAHRVSALLLFCFALAYLPIRLVQEANPEWRMISWALAIEVIAMTLLFIDLALGRKWMIWMAFPFCFFLVAVPWPTIVEGPMIQGLTRLNSAAVVEILSWTGIPAIQHGNLIEVSTGTVGVDEACSGIRSFQTSLMISLFFGEFYAMGLWRRLLLLPCGFALAMVFNIGRMCFLTIVAAKNGIAAISVFHDPAGFTVAIVCTIGLWALAVLVNGKPGESAQQSGVREIEVGKKASVFGVVAEISRRNLQSFDFSSRKLTRLCFVLLVWFLFVEISVEGWYRWHESRLPKSASWSLDWPRTNATFSEIPLPPRTKQLLRYDEGVSATWMEDDGTHWQMIYLRWLPGRVAVHLAKSHTPEVCLAAAGHSVECEPTLEYVNVHGLRLPFRVYRLNEGAGTSYVFYCLWEDRAGDRSFQTTLLTYENRLDPVLQGRRNIGQRSLEAVIQGNDDLESAKAALARQLEKIVRTDTRDLAASNPQS